MTTPSITPEEVAQRLRQLAVAQRQHNRVVGSALTHLGNENDARKAEFGVLLQSATDLVGISTSHDGRITGLETRVDDIATAVRPESIRRQVVEVTKEGGKLASVGALIGAVIGLIVGIVATGHNSVTNSTGVHVVIVNLGLARTMIVISCILVGAIVGALVMGGATGSRTQTTVDEEEVTEPAPPRPSRITRVRQALASEPEPPAPRPVRETTPVA